jgi:hypothetical protein
MLVNLVAGPGAGKTFCAWTLAAEAKRNHISTEIIGEAAKELIRNGMEPGKFGQYILFGEQLRREVSLIGKVDLVITDSPVFLGLPYARKYAGKKQYNALLQVMKCYYDTLCEQEPVILNVFVNRPNCIKYESEGRLESLQEAMDIDEELRDLASTHFAFPQVSTGTSVSALMRVFYQVILPVYNKKGDLREADRSS